MRFIEALNAIHDNLLALVILGAGVALILHNQVEAGRGLMMLGAGVFNRQVAAAGSPKSPAPAETK